MAQKLYVGNLPFTATEDALRAVFAQHGEVISVRLITDRDTGRPRGFGFVEMQDGRAAIANLDGQDFEGRTLKVNEAQNREAGGGGGGRRKSW
jgi:RNA recognition motif-containing protein